MGLWLKLSSEVAHELSHWALPVYSRVFGVNEIPHHESFTWRGLTFPNRLGVAGGMDKNAEHISDWWRLGAGFVEIGTVTPRPQSPNPGRIMDRDSASMSLWNRMGFPSKGANEVAANLKQLQRHLSPVLVNIGKNRDTNNARAFEDYLYLVKKFSNLADIFVVNISSPNTKDLRQLQSQEQLSNFLQPILEESRKYKKPVLLKLSPDQHSDELSEAVRTAANLGVDGFVLTNTTTSRLENSPFPKEGGVSGAPLKKLSQNALSVCVAALGGAESTLRKDKLIISVGGVLDAKEAEERIKLGADLVEFYSALVFKGPHFFIDSLVETEKMKNKTNC
jgi:dihydroorotate dehydrogenase